MPFGHNCEFEDFDACLAAGHSEAWCAEVMRQTEEHCANNAKDLHMETLFVYDEIGDRNWGLISDRDVAEFVANLEEDAPLLVRVNSPGGDVFKGVAIYETLRNHAGHVTVQIDGLAASAASLIPLAADRATISEGGFVMMHNPWAIAMGDSEEFRKMADTLDRVRQSLVNMYSRGTKLESSSIEAMLDEETWLNAEDALGMGFVDEINTEPAVAASIRPGVFQAIPRELVRSEDGSNARRAAAKHTLYTGKSPRRQRLDTLKQQLRQAT